MADKKISALTDASTPLAGTEVLPIVQSGTTVKVAVSDLTAGRITAMGNNSTVGTSSVFPFITTNGAKVGNDANSPTRVTVGNQDTGASAVSGIGFESAGGGWQIDVPPDVVTFANPLIGKFNGTEVFRFKSTGSFAPVNGAGIDFSATGQAGGMTSELLNDYEEGTWTPVVTSSTGSITTIGAVYGGYTKVGRIVYATYDIIINNNGTGGGYIKCDGLPYSILTRGFGAGVEADVVGFGLLNIGIAGTAYCYITKYDGATYAGGNAYHLIGNITYNT